MNLDFLKDIGNQLTTLWREIKTYQKFSIIITALALAGLIGFLSYNAASTRYTPLFPADRLHITDAAEVKSYLDGSRIPYKIKGDSLILVPVSSASKIRMDLAAVGLPKNNSSKGFELFDSNTWIKGEKELQILEMRALKGQLEKDISEYENIKDASVILDLAPPRPFGGAMYKTKASIILNLMPGARLNNAQLRSITFHISGAVRGLLPNMIAISDTRGKLYQSIDPDNNMDMLRSSEIAVEERLKAKVDGMLNVVVGTGNYYSTVQVVMNRDKRTEERKIFSGQVNGVELGESVVSSITESGLQLSEVERAEQGSPGTNNEAIAGAVIGGSDDILNRDESRNQTHKRMSVPINHVKVRSTPGKISDISIGVLIDKTITISEDADLPGSEIVDGRRNAIELQTEIESQLSKILEGYQIATTPAVDFVEFDKTKVNKQAAEDSWSTTMGTVTKAGSALFVIMTVIGMFWTFNRFWKRHMMQPPNLEEAEENEENEFEFTEESTLVEVEAMVESIRSRFQNDPNTIVETVREWVSEETELTKK